MNSEQIRKMPVGVVLDALKAGAYMELGHQFRVFCDNHPRHPYICYMTWEGESWSEPQTICRATIDDVAEMLIYFAQVTEEAENAQR